MTAPLVPRHLADVDSPDPDDEVWYRAQIVTDSDAAKLEAVVEAARRVRSLVDLIDFGPCEDKGCGHDDCETLRAFDAAVAELGVKP